MEIKWRMDGDESEDNTPLLPLEIRHFPPDVQGSAGLLLIGNLLPTLGMLLFRWDIYHVLLFYLCEIMVILVRDYFFSLWNVARSNTLGTILIGCFLLLFYAPMLVAILAIGFPVLVDLFGPEALKGQVSALQRSRGAPFFSQKLLELFYEQASAVWLPLLAMVAHQAINLALAAARAARMGRKLQPRPYSVIRYIILLFLLIGGVGFMGKIGYVYRGILLYLGVKCWGDLSDFVLDYLGLSIGDTNAAASEGRPETETSAPEHGRNG